MCQLATPVISTPSPPTVLLQLLTLQRELLVYELASFVQVRQHIVWVCAQKVKACPRQAG